MQNVYPTRPCDCGNGRRTCERCNGNGRVQCLHGSVFHTNELADCDACDSMGWKRCPESGCRDGTVTCRACDGTGRRAGMAGILD